MFQNLLRVSLGGCLVQLRALWVDHAVVLLADAPGGLQQPHGRVGEGDGRGARHGDALVTRPSSCRQGGPGPE